MHDPVLFLASRSPRRRDLLLQVGLQHSVVEADVDETPLAGECPKDYVVRMALSKARAGCLAVPPGSELPVLAADTAVVCDSHILGKPADAEDARAMLQLLSGRAHQVFTGVAVLGQHEQTALSETRVRFRRIDPAEAAAYWRSGEAGDKAGAYAIQGLGALFVEEVTGSYSGVVGLPLFETAALLAREGVRPLGPLTGR